MAQCLPCAGPPGLKLKDLRARKLHDLQAGWSSTGAVLMLSGGGVILRVTLRVRKESHAVDSLPALP